MKKALWILMVVLFMQCQPQRETEENKDLLITTPSGLRYRVLKPGSGVKAGEGDEVLIYETTMYKDGTVLYSNEEADQPLKVKIGAGMVLEGIDEGLQGMRAGEIRELHLPYFLAKRTMYPDHISPDSALVIKMIVKEVIKAP